MFTLPDLPYSYSALEPHLDSLTLEIHHTRHHAAYVKNLNDVLPDKTDSDLQNILSNLGNFPESIRTKIRNHAGGHFNHSLFWTGMSPAPSAPDPGLLARIQTDYGDMNTLKEKVLTAAVSVFGSGWAWLVVTDGHLEVVQTANQDNPVSNGQLPILGTDVWEHAYYLKYQNRRADYLQALWNVINWNEVSERFLTAHNS